MTRRRLISLLAAFVLCAASPALRAQHAGGPLSHPAAVPPGTLLTAAFGDEAASAEAVRAWLAEGRAEGPQGVAERAKSLIESLGARAGTLGAETLVRLVDRISADAIRMIHQSRVARLAVDSGFVPTNAVVALRFAASGEGAGEGFETVRPGDRRIGGAGIGPGRASDGNGIDGIERIELDIPDGSYRVVLMIPPAPAPAGTAGAGAGEIVVNGVVYPLSGLDDPAGDLLLSNDTSGSPDAGRTGSAGGQNVYAVMVDAEARDGKLIIEMRGFGASTPPLAGLVVEPAAAASDFVLSQEFVGSYVPLALRLSLEEDVLAAAAAVLAYVAPAADRARRLVEVPEPVLDPEELASISE